MSKNLIPTRYYANCVEVSKDTPHDCVVDAYELTRDPRTFDTGIASINTFTIRIHFRHTVFTLTAVCNKFADRDDDFSLDSYLSYFPPGYKVPTIDTSVDLQHAREVALTIARGLDEFMEFIATYAPDYLPSFNRVSKADGRRYTDRKGGAK